jgi:hypothetical protein
LIALELAALMGTLDPEKKKTAARALKTIQSLSRNGSDSAYRQAVNDTIRQAFALCRPTALENAKKACARLSAEERQDLRAWA